MSTMSEYNREVEEEHLKKITSELEPLSPVTEKLGGGQAMEDDDPMAWFSESEIQGNRGMVWVEANPRRYVTVEVVCDKYLYENNRNYRESVQKARFLFKNEFSEAHGVTYEDAIIVDEHIVEGNFPSRLEFKSDDAAFRVKNGDAPYRRPNRSAKVVFKLGLI